MRRVPHWYLDENYGIDALMREAPEGAEGLSEFVRAVDYANLELERSEALHQLTQVRDTACDVIEGLEVMQLSGAMPARVRKLRAALSASLDYTSEKRLPVTTYVVVVRSACGGGERLYDRTRHTWAGKAGAVANSLNASGELQGAVAFYRAANADDIEQTTLD